MKIAASAAFQVQNIQSRRFTNSAAAVGSGNGKELQRLKEVTKDFEALFVKQMLNSMRSTVHKNGLVDGGFAENIYEDMLYDQYADKMAKTANLGIAKMLYNQMSAYL